MTDLAHLNEKQRMSVTSDARNLIILAGPGSGKTRVLVHRIAWLIEQGVNPANVLAVTFTNKAAREMKERLAGMLTPAQAKRVTARTFHSFGARVLREEARVMAALLGKEGAIATIIDRKELTVAGGRALNTNFTIYDDGDQRNLLTGVIKEMNLDSKRFPVDRAAEVISGWKNSGYLPGDMVVRTAAEADNPTKVWRDVYVVYQSRLLAANAVDFDDLILYPMLLFKGDTGVLRRYQERYPYVLVDEFQDTNGVQYRLTEMLTDHPAGRLTVVGDEDQAIYGWRGADFTNVKRLMTARPDHRLELLEQNYRSVPAILAAANALIGNNFQRVAKRLWTQLSGGEPAIRCLSAADGDQEAAQIAALIGQAIEGGQQPADIAILYRTNSQSRALETGLLRAGIPYRLARGVAFYQRKEIRDAMAYLRLLYNGDPLSFQRIANVPKRGLGDTTVKAVLERVSDLGQWLPDFYEAGQRVGGDTAGAATWKRLAQQYGLTVTPGAAQKLWGFAAVVAHLRRLPHPTPRELVEAVIGILRPAYDEQERIENLLELLTVAEQVEETGLAGLEAFLESAALATDTDDTDTDENRVTLATLHAAKGLEWPIVFLAGAEDGYCPSRRQPKEGGVSAGADLEEERRLFYVGVTRAKARLVISYADDRQIFGEWKTRQESPFIAEMGL